MLQFEGVTFARDGFTLSADFELPPGARVAILGASGSGKSTFLDLVAGFLKPTSGTVFWQGTPLDGDPGVRPVSMVFQDENLFPHISVEDNVSLGASLRVRPGADVNLQVLAALERVGLGGFAGRRPAELSGGQRSRVALARVLVRKKPILALDEPLSALGPAMAEEMLNLVVSIADDLQATVLLVSHRPSEARAFATHVCFVEDGQVGAPIAAKRFFEAPPSGYVAYQGKGT